jgi:serine protease Do
MISRVRPLSLRVTPIALLMAVATLLGLPLDAGAQGLGDLFRKVNPSVVVIRTKGRDVSESGQVRFGEGGSGVLISADGKVMTAAHVVHAMDEITVEVVGGTTVPACVISSEPAADLSRIKLDRVPPGAVVAPMANSDAVRVGDQVIVVGAPYGLSYSMSVGWISARWPPNTVYKAMPLAEFFQTGAVINSGNSGGPIFNMAGTVIGVVSHNISKSGGSEGLGFVVAINTAKKLLLEERSF